MATATETTFTDTSVTLDTLESFTAPHDGWCVSLYLPTHRAGKEIRQDPIRLKNRLTDAEEQLEAAGVDGESINKMCSQVRELCDLDSDDNREFWRHQGDALAVLIGEDEQRIVRLEGPTDELSVVAHRFHVKPLVRELQRDQEYCVLAVSQGDVRFLKGTHTGLSECEVDDLPESLQAVVGGDHQKGFKLHSFRAPGTGAETAVPHGHVDKDQLHELKRYFGDIAEALHDELKFSTRPLVFAGVDELFPYFKEEVEYEHLIDEPIAGNPDDLSPEQLHERAWPHVAKKRKAQQAAAVERYNEVGHTDTGEDDLQRILVAAHDGRIDTLVLHADAHTWGAYDVDARQATIDDSSTADNYDLLDLAAVKTLRADGQVVMLDETELPDGKTAAAVCRYPAPQ